MFLFLFMFKKTKKKLVLIVEDDALLAKVLEKRLAEEKFEVRVVEDGLEAVKVVEYLEPNLILLDLILPGLDGFGVLREIKQNPETAKIPVAVISNLSSISDVKSAKTLGAEEFFIKANSSLDQIIAYVKKI